MSTTSAQARSKPITNRSAGACPLIADPDDGYSGPSAVTPSMEATKLAYTHGSRNPRSPP
jgi:hypothetical protein